MMTAKEYVADKVKSYTRLAKRCREEAETSDDIVVRAEYSARANVWEMCARRLGYKSVNSFASACSHSRSGKHPAHKYIFEKEYIRRDEVDSLPPVRRKRKKSLPVRQHGQAQRVMKLQGHITPKNNPIRRICKWQLCRFMTGLKTRRNFWRDVLHRRWEN